MSCCGTESDPEAKKVSKAIDGTIKKERKLNDLRFKLLLLGTGDAGKSTFAKQMKRLYTGPFSTAEREKFNVILKNNILSNIKLLINGMQAKNISVEPKLKDDLKKVIEATELNIEIGESIALLWNDPAIQKVYEMGREISRLGCQTAYYMENVQRISKPDYVPTDEDVFRAKIKTTGIIETLFNAGGFSFNLVDVGGQRTERRKWLHCFDGTTAVIYLAALDAYDLVLEEDENTNRMQESLKLFAEISGSPYFKNASFILFLNKMDLLQDKIKHSPLSNLFPEYEGGSDPKLAIEFIKQKYLEVFTGNRIFNYLTCALDTDNIKKVFYSVKKILLKSDLDDCGLLSMVDDA
eukprot:TRINITY_DN3644_c1_g1_i1.p1 TRINITY_DN3644_c1_g1~~TRINITY_DN3644_c1_g1_i1.p1  ORF type:complete len:352 (-),score=65.01 TRINITY_DN3644_c1_g1_i1:84-1139(-)